MVPVFAIITGDSNGSLDWPDVAFTLIITTGHIVVWLSTLAAIAYLWRIVLDAFLDTAGKSKASAALLELIGNVTITSKFTLSGTGLLGTILICYLSVLTNREIAFHLEGDSKPAATSTAAEEPEE
jgi:hypothetical protein